MNCRYPSCSRWIYAGSGGKNNYYLSFPCIIQPHFPITKILIRYAMIQKNVYSIQTYCEVGTPEYEKKKQESYDVHSPANIRVIGAISNMKDFAKVFNCPEGSAMNPTNKCNIWNKPDIVQKSLQTSDGKTKMKHHPWRGDWKLQN